MENRVDAARDSRTGREKKAPIPMTLTDFLLTHMLLSPTPVVAVSTAILGEESVEDETPRAVECFVLRVPWQREC
jgi:hypothetical protein